MKISLFGWVIFIRKHRRFRGSQYADEALKFFEEETTFGVLG